MSTTAIQDIEDLQRLLATNFPEIQVDGDIGKRTVAAVQSARGVSEQFAKDIQLILQRRSPNLVIDGVIGPKSISVLHDLDEAGDHESVADTKLDGSPSDEHKVLASSFADLADVSSFRRCKASGGSDQHCFKSGDNGIGAWGHNTAQEDTPMVALPREVWRKAGRTGGAKVIVTYKDRSIVAILGDTMPSLANIHNGAGMDTNPAVARAFGLRPPYMLPMTWRWA